MIAAVAGRVLGETQLLDATGKHRREGPGKTPIVLVDLSKVNEQVCFDEARLLDQRTNGREKIFAADRGEQQ